MKPDVHILKNGLKVILIDTKAFPSVTTLLLVGAGSRYETKENNGIAHFLEHMFFKGSPQYPTPYDVSTAIEGLGGAWNAFTSKDYTGYYIKATNEHFDTMIDILSDILLRPLLDPREIEKEKGVITEEINMYEDMPQSRVGEVFENLLYPTSPLGFDVIGTKQTISSFSKKTFTDYMDSLYRPSNSVLVVAGGLGGRNDHLKKITDTFGQWEDHEVAAYEKVIETQSSPQIQMYTKKTEQAHFCLGFRAFPFTDKRRYALTVLATVLGGGASSRLFMEVRERKGLCYYIHTGRQHYADSGNIATQAGVPKDISKLKLAVTATLEEHKQLSLGKVTDEEINRAKEIIKGHFFLSLEDSYNVASYYGKRNLLEGTMVSPKEYITELANVTKEDITIIAKKLFVPENLNVAVVGPFNETDLKASDLVL